MKRSVFPGLGLATVTALSALTFVAADAHAQDKTRAPLVRPPLTKAQPSAPTPPATPPPATPPPAVAAPVDAGAADAGAKVKGKEGPDQKKRRTDYIARVSKEVRALVRANGIISAEEKELVRQHWRRSMRAHRIRVLAEDEKDPAVVARVDAFLAKIDKALIDRLKDLQKKAPAAAKTDGGAK